MPCDGLQDFMHVGKNVAVKLCDYSKLRLTSTAGVGGGTALGTALERLASLKLPTGVPRAATRLLDPSLPNNQKKTIYYHYFMRYHLLLLAVWALLPDECAPTRAGVSFVSYIYLFIFNRGSCRLAVDKVGSLPRAGRLA